MLGVSTFPLTNADDGSLPLPDIVDAIRFDDPHCPITSCVALENTQNLCNGRVLSLDYVGAVAALCKERGLAFHMDGARLANAAVALGVPLATAASGVDSVSLCLSKGLGAPVGSILAGSGAFIHMVGTLPCVFVDVSIFE